MKEGNILPPTNSPGRGRGEERGKCTTRGTGRGWADVVSGNLYGPRRDVVLDAPQICLNLCGLKAVHRKRALVYHPCPPRSIFPLTLHLEKAFLGL